MVFVLSLLPVSSAIAGTISVNTVYSNGTVGAGTMPSPVAISFAGDTVTVGFQTWLEYDTTVLDATATGANGGDCAANDQLGRITSIHSDPGNLPLPSAVTTYCTITFTFTSQVVPPASLALDLVVPDGDFACFNNIADPVPCALVDGAINLSANFFWPTLSYSPTFDSDGVSDATPEVVFPVTQVGNAISASITPTATGGSPPGSVALSCAVSSGFTLVSGGVQNFTGPGSGAGAPIRVQATLTTVIQTGTLTCTETPTPLGAITTRVWDLIAPAGESTPGEVIFSPPSGSGLAIQGAPGSLASGVVSFTNLDIAPLTITGCVVSGAPAITVQSVTSPVAPGAVGTVNLSCAVPSAGSASGTLTCNTSSQSLPVYTIAVTCGAPSTAVPGLSGLGAAMLALMMLGIGLATTGYIRSS